MLKGETVSGIAVQRFYEMLENPKPFTPCSAAADYDFKKMARELENDKKETPTIQTED